MLYAKLVYNDVHTNLKTHGGGVCGGRTTAYHVEWMPWETHHNCSAIQIMNTNIAYFLLLMMA